MYEAATHVDVQVFDHTAFVPLPKPTPCVPLASQLAWWGVAFWGTVFYAAFGRKKKEAPAPEEAAKA